MLPTLSSLLEVQKAGSRSGAVALLTFFSELDEDSDSLEILHDMIVSAGAGVTGHGVPFLTFKITPDASGYSVRIRNETESVAELTLHQDMPDGTTVDFDSPVETTLTFHLPAQVAIDVALADEDKKYETMEMIRRQAGGFIYHVEKEFGQTHEYAQQMREE
jgi:hypothetical protein